MTKAEQRAKHRTDLLAKLADEEAAYKQRQAENKKALEQLDKQDREADKKAREKRRYQLGKLADDTGLLAWDDLTLTGLFQALTLLLDTPDPVAVLEGVLTDTNAAASYLSAPSPLGQASLSYSAGNGEMAHAGKGRIGDPSGYCPNTLQSKAGV